MLLDCFKLAKGHKIRSAVQQIWLQSVAPVKKCAPPTDRLISLTSPAVTWRHYHTHKRSDRTVQTSVPPSHSRCPGLLWWHSLAIQCDPAHRGMLISAFRHHILTLLKQNRKAWWEMQSEKLESEKRNHDLLSTGNKRQLDLQWWRIYRTEWLTNTKTLIKKLCQHSDTHFMRSWILQMTRGAGVM